MMLILDSPLTDGHLVDLLHLLCIRDGYGDFDCTENNEQEISELRERRLFCGMS